MTLAIFFCVYVEYGGSGIPAEIPDRSERELWFVFAANMGTYLEEEEEKGQTHNLLHSCSAMSPLFRP